MDSPKMSYTSDSIIKMTAKAVAGYPAIKKLVHRLGIIQSHKLDAVMGKMHRKEFEIINCLECAGCCKTISPAMNDNDLRRMASAIKQSVPAFIDAYIYLDDEGDYVFKLTPCPFLGDDNYCSIYESRPRACREYPHTDRKRFYQVLDLTAKNSTVCPAVFNILEKISKMCL
jgi:Fe-S-cluster containining protein